MYILTYIEAIDMDKNSKLKILHYSTPTQIHKHIMLHIVQINQN